MYRALVSLGVMMVLAGGTAWAQAKVDVATERAAVEQTVHDNICWALTKDRAMAERTMAHDAGLFIFNPTSKPTVGWEDLAKNFTVWMDPRFKATRCDIRELRVTLSRSADAAWWSAMLDDLAEWDGKPTGWKDTRWTGVLEKRDGAWVIVQMHFSFAADKVRADALAEAKKQPEANPAVRDADGNSYRTATIGGQVWMAENLRSTRTCAGAPIEHDVHPRSRDAVTTYGRLYTEAAARNGDAASTADPSGVRGICPCGWHLPSDAEWQHLVDALGGAAAAGGKLKERGAAHWTGPNAGATDEIGFAAVPAGWHDFTGEYEGLGNRAFFRTASGTRVRVLDHDATAVGAGNIHPRDAASVRCLKDR